MRITEVVLVAALGGGAYYLWQEHKAAVTPAGSQPQPESPSRPSSSPGASAPAKSSVASSPSAPARLTCYACKGEGRLMLRKEGRRRGADSSYMCPVCRGSGFRSIESSGPVCKDCGGMGFCLYHPDYGTVTVEEMGLYARDTGSAIRWSARPCGRCRK